MTRRVGDPSAAVVELLKTQDDVNQTARTSRRAIPSYHSFVPVSPQGAIGWWETRFSTPGWVKAWQTTIPSLTHEVFYALFALYSYGVVAQTWDQQIVVRSPSGATVSTPVLGPYSTPVLGSYQWYSLTWDHGLDMNDPAWDHSVMEVWVTTTGTTLPHPIDHFCYGPMIQVPGAQVAGTANGFTVF